MATNEGWPEAFGFSISGDAPVVVGEVEDGGSAQQAGLQTGDVIVELDGENVQQWTKNQVQARATQAAKVPPSLVVISRVRKFKIPRGADGGFGITLRGDCPVFIRSVDFHSPARAAGVRSGDLILELNRHSVRYASKGEVLELLKGAGQVLQLVVIAGGLRSTPVPRDHHRRAELRYQKAKAFHNKVSYYLLHDETKRSHLLTLLRLYARDRDIASLGSSLDVLLETATERRLLTDIRAFIQSSHRARFDALVSYATKGHASHRRGSCEIPRPLGATRRDDPHRSSLPSLLTTSSGERLVRVNRGRSGFGFTLSGNAPVFIRGVDPGGAAAGAGLRAGDHLLELNGLNIRNATHSYVIRLLKGSGTQPTLLVSAHPPGHGMASRRGSTASSTSDAMKRRSTAFKEKMEHILLQDERQHVVQQLTQFSQHKDLPKLVHGLGAVLNDANKMVLFHYICQLLPEEAQTEFDRIAAGMLAGDSPVVRASYGTEAVGDMLYRVQSDKLPAEEQGSPRWVLGSQFHPRWGGAGVGGDGVGSAGVGGAGVGSSRESGTGNHLEDSFISAGEELVLQDTPIRQVGQSHSLGERSSGGEGMGQGSPQWLNPPGGHGVDPQYLNPSGGAGGMGLEAPSFEEALRGKKEGLENRLATPTTASATADVSTSSTPGAVPLPPVPPPTPQGGVGGVPIPPPPPPTLPGTSSQSHLKRVNWEKVPGTEGTIWRELSGLDEALEYYELEKQFANQKTKNATRVKSKQPSVLEPRKAYNLSILLGHLKLPFDKIRVAVLACDDSVLSEQHLRQMESFAPSKQECLGLAHYYNNPGILNLPDRFSCEMSSIPCYHERLRAMLFRLHFWEKLEEVRPDLEAISLATVQLRTSKKLKRVLEIVLALGNYMNAGNHRVGGAQGFRIAYLAQLKSLRTTDSKSSLLHFLAGTVERKFPNVLDFPDDLSYASRAARVSGQTLETEIRELNQGLKDIRRDVREVRAQEKLPGDRFEEVMISFLAEADEKMADMMRLYSHMQQEYQKTIRFFGEDAAQMRIDDFFGAFAAFTTDFQKAVQENRTAREQEALRERRAKEREELQKRRGSQKVYSKRDSGGGFDLKKELEARKSRTIDVASLERTKQSKALAPPQQDYRHLLRPPKGRSKRGSSGEQQRWSRASDSIPPPSQFAGYDTEDSDDQELEFDDETQF